MDGYVHFVAHLNAREIHERSMKDNALGIADFRDGLCHDVILCFTGGARQPGNYGFRGSGKEENFFRWKEGSGEGQSMVES